MENAYALDLEKSRTQANAQNAQELEVVRSDSAKELEPFRIHVTAKNAREPEAIRDNNTREIETIRAEIAARRDDVSARMNGLTSSYTALHARIVYVLESVWTYSLTVHKAVASPADPTDPSTWGLGQGDGCKDLTGTTWSS